MDMYKGAKRTIFAIFERVSRTIFLIGMMQETQTASENKDPSNSSKEARL
jgi:hypothetical protein